MSTCSTTVSLVGTEEEVYDRTTKAWSNLFDSVPATQVIYDKQFPNDVETKIAVAVDSIKSNVPFAAADALGDSVDISFQATKHDRGWTLKPVYTYTSTDGNTLTNRGEGDPEETEVDLSLQDLLIVPLGSKGNEGQTNHDPSLLYGIPYTNHKFVWGGDESMTDEERLKEAEKEFSHARAYTHSYAAQLELINGLGEKTVDMLIPIEQSVNKGMSTLRDSMGKITSSSKSTHQHTIRLAPGVFTLPDGKIAVYHGWAIIDNSERNGRIISSADYSQEPTTVDGETSKVWSANKAPPKRDPRRYPGQEGFERLENNSSVNEELRKFYNWKRDTVM